MVANVNGPAITPKTLKNNGGGNAMPPYLQGISGGQPMVTPKSTAVPGEVATPGQIPKQSQPPTQVPQVTPKAQAGQTPTGIPQAGGQSMSDVYNFFKSDLENQRKQAKAGAIADASARGVYYGTPLTGSEADIDTQFLRGLGQLQAGMYGNEQQNQLARLQLAATMLQGEPQANAGGINPSLYQMLGSLFGGSQAASGQRTGPTQAQPPLTKKTTDRFGPSQQPPV